MDRADNFLNGLEHLVRRGAMESALRALRALPPLRQKSQRCASLRSAAVQLQAQLKHAAGSGPTAAAKADRVRIEKLVLEAIGEARDLFAKAILCGDDISRAEAVLESLPPPMSASDNAIFISYRRADSADAVGRMRERLEGSFGKGTIFVDVASMPLGVDFRHHVETCLRRCRACLVVIGPQWLNVSKSGIRRLDMKLDLVRAEIEIALSLPLLVVPIFVGHASMPARVDLPESIVPLANRSGMQMRPDPDFDHDAARLIEKLQESMTSATSPTAGHPDP